MRLFHASTLLLTLLSLMQDTRKGAYATRYPVQSLMPLVAHCYKSHPELLESLDEASKGIPILLDAWKDKLLPPMVVAMNFANLHLPNFAGTAYRIKNAYSTKHNQIYHIYLRQLYLGLEIMDADMNVNVGPQGNVLSYGESLFQNDQNLDLLRLPATISPIDALEALVQHIQLSSFKIHGAKGFVPLTTRRVREDAILLQSETFDSADAKASIYVPWSRSAVSAKLAWLQVPTGDGECSTLVQVWSLELELTDNWINAFVSAKAPGSLIGMVDWVSDLLPSYMIYPISPQESEPELRESLQGVSPLGWHSQGLHGTNKVYDTTIGNNVYAQENEADTLDWQLNYRPSGGPELKFHFAYDHSKDPEYSVNASVTNLFYWNNWMHDIFYTYGFDEVAGNFQKNNFDRGGNANDPVIANAQDGSGTDNANFATPPDGRPARMRMYIWTQSEPNRDGDLDAGIIIHEYGHGISTRLTGGPDNSNCLLMGESGGMGEGWGDFWATIFRQTANNTRNDIFEIGSYANNGRGIRYYPYTSNMEINPSTYRYIVQPRYVGAHSKGELWAIFLLEAYWNAVDEAGFDPDWLHGNGGNNLFLRNVVDGLKLQPCRPSFLDARDAILLADTINHNGRLVCAIWRGFAKRGLGHRARPDGKEDFTIPPVCFGK